MLTTTNGCDNIKSRKQPTVVREVTTMKRQNKIYLASTLTVLAAFTTLISLFAMDGISLQTVIALVVAAAFGYLTSCFFKVENILRKQNAAALRKQRQARASMAVVRGTAKSAQVA